MSKQPLRPFVLTESDKIGGLHHIAYEMEQITDLLSTFPREKGLQMNAWLEALLIHVRQLIDFFEHSKRSIMKGQENDDVLAADYGFSAQPIQIDAIFRERLNKDLAHLSYSRQQRIESSKNWNLRDILPLIERCKEFTDHVCHSWKSKLTTKEVQRWEKLAQTLV
jgi:hypothetical protein